MLLQHLFVIVLYFSVSLAAQISYSQSTEILSNEAATTYLQNTDAISAENTNPEVVTDKIGSTKGLATKTAVSEITIKTEVPTTQKYTTDLPTTDAATTAGKIVSQSVTPLSEDSTSSDKTISNKLPELNDKEVEKTFSVEATNEDLKITIVENSSNDHVVLIQGQMAVVLAGVFVTVAIIGYIAMLSRRRYLERRYGDRHALVDEMEFNDRDDTITYFSI